MPRFLMTLPSQWSCMRYLDYYLSIHYSVYSVRQTNLQGEVETLLMIISSKLVNTRIYFFNSTTVIKLFINHTMVTDICVYYFGGGRGCSSKNPVLTLGKARLR